MKTHTIISILLLLCNISYSQITVSNDLLKKIYLGIENPISITVSNFNMSDVVVTASIGTLKKTTTGKYTWQVCSSEKKSAWLKVYNKSKLVDSLFFRIIRLPEPSIKITSQKGQINFEPGSGIRADIDNFSVEGIFCKIEKFKLAVIKSEGDTLRYENYGDSFKKLHDELSPLLKEGEKVIFYDFFVWIGCEKEPRKLSTELKFFYTKDEIHTHW